MKCPHCGKQLESTKKKGISLRKGSLLAFIVWAALTAVLIGLLVLTHGVSPYRIDYFVVMGFCATPILYAFGIWAIYNNARRHGRNTVRWTTAAIVFSPVLA